MALSGVVRYHPAVLVPMDQTAVPAIQIADTAKFQVEVTEQFMMILVILAILYTVGGYPQEFRQQMNVDFQQPVRGYDNDACEWLFIKKIIS